MSSMEHLSDQQIARVEALMVAREVGRKTGGPFGPVTPADVPEMVDIAEYVINGTHPMDRYSDNDTKPGEPINIIFDGPPGHESGRFVEVENDNGESISVGEWSEQAKGMWSLRITSLPEQTP